MTIVDLFSGFGWDVAARELGLDPIGLELDRDACATRALHGLATIRTDVAAYPAERFGKIEGLIASPPCQDFSRAGKRGGLSTERGQLVFQVERWVEACRPEWVACEQTEDVLPIWELIAMRLRNLGYRTWTGLLKAERYGVPQTRTRAVLMAHRDLVPHPPVPTHQEYVFGEPARYEPASMFHGEILPWVSMAEALGWGMTERPMLTVTHGTGSGGADPMLVGGSGARATIANEREAGRWKLHTRCGYDGIEVTRDDDQPAPTFTVKAGGQWYFDRPATTIACDPRVFQPGGHHTPGAQSENAVKITVDEAKVLQSLNRHFAVAGNKTSQFRQIGNMVPPLLAHAILEALGVARLQAAA